MKRVNAYRSDDGGPMETWLARKMIYNKIVCPRERLLEAREFMEKRYGLQNRMIASTLEGAVLRLRHGPVLGSKKLNANRSVEEDAVLFDLACGQDFWFWVSGGMSLLKPDDPARAKMKPVVWTVDEHEETEELVVKPFPWEKAYIRQYVDLLLTKRHTATWKSRKTMATWCAVARFTHMAQFMSGREIIFQCKHEEESKARLLERAWFIYQNQPKFLQRLHPAEKRETTITWYDPAGKKPPSRVLAVPEGDGPWRGPVVSGGIGDEVAHMTDFKSAYEAAMASVMGRKSMFLAFISSPNGKDFFYRLSHDIDEDRTAEENPAPMQILRASSSCKHHGLKWRDLTNGFTGIYLHASADPDKDPCTPEGKQYWEAVNRAYKGNRIGLNREFNLSADVCAGTPVYGLAFDEEKNVSSTLVYQRGKPVYRGWDFGYHNPFCVWAYKDDEDRWLVLYELMGKQIQIYDFADRVKERSRKWFAFPNEKGELVEPDYYDFCDPAGTQKSDKSKKSSVQVLNSKGIYPAFQKLGIDQGLIIVRNMIVGTDHGPELLFSESGCPILIEGMKGGYAYPEKKADDSDKESEVPDKDGYYDHGMDGLRYLMTGVRTPSGKDMSRGSRLKKKAPKVYWGAKVQEE